MTTIRVVLLLVLVSLLSGCGYNTIRRKDEGVKTAWSQVINQYKRRADLVPNLVNTVKGYASHEEKGVPGSRGRALEGGLDQRQCRRIAIAGAVRGSAKGPATRSVAC